MKLLLIAVVISIHASGFLTPAEAACKPRCNGGYGGAGGTNVVPRWTFDPKTNHCEQVMTKGQCQRSENCFPSVDECESECGPTLEQRKL
uniref:Putative salivary kunitz domain protein n=1 Tax=Ixodes ricinus TaxID=34613 RepID=A0A0K8RJK2_IXORI